METETQKFNTDDANFADVKDSAARIGAANTIDAVAAHDSDATNITATIAANANANQITEVEEANSINEVNEVEKVTSSEMAVDQNVVQDEAEDKGTDIVPEEEKET